MSVTNTQTLIEASGIYNPSLKRSLDEVRIAVEAIWEDNIRIIRGYTNHGIDHCDRVIEKAEWLINGKGSGLLSEQEEYVLFASAYLHDIGMQCDVVRFPEIKERAESLGAEFNVAFGGRSAADYTLNEQESIRANHHFLSAAWIDTANNDHENVLHNAITSIPPILIRDLMDVCMYHSKLRIGDCPNNFEHIRGRKDLIAALVRFSDELDIDTNKVTIQTVKAFNLPPRNAIYWWMHNRTIIEYDTPRENSIRITVSLNYNDFDNYGHIIKRLFIDDYVEKNNDLRDTLERYGFGVSIDHGSNVKRIRYERKLPQDIIDYINAMGDVKPGPFYGIP